MRRYLTVFLGISAVVAAVAGCAVSAEDPAPTSGPGGGGISGGGSSGVGGDGYSSKGGGKDSVTAPIILEGDSLSCSPDGSMAALVYLARPQARAMVSGAQVRGVIAAGKAPLPSVVRREEILNYYHVGCPVDPSAPDRLAIVPALFHGDSAGAYELQVTVCAPANKAPRRPTALTVVVDTSKSMAGESLSRARSAVEALASRLNPGDVLTLFTSEPGKEPFVVKATDVGVPTLGEQLDQLMATGGDDDLNVVLSGAYAATVKASLPGGINRVVLITDGGAPGDALKTALLEDGLKNKIQLVGVGVGNAAGYHNDLLAAATEAGHGANVYLDSSAEAKAMLGDRFDEVLDTAARGLRILVQLPWLFDPKFTSDHVGSQEIMDLGTSDLGPGGSMVFRLSLHTCSGVDLAQAKDEVISINGQWGSPTATAPTLVLSKPISPTVAGLLQSPATDQVLKTSAIYAFADALSSLNLSRLQLACTTVVDAQAQIKLQSPLGTPPDPDLDSILTQIKTHPLMKGQDCPPPKVPAP